MSQTIETLAPGFLIAAPALKDPNFDHTVILMCMHDTDGAMGLVINRAAPLTIRDIMGQLGIECLAQSSANALMGGPVALDSGLLLYQTDPQAPRKEDELWVADNLRLCPNRDLLTAIGQGQGPQEYLMFLGHAGWTPGQLEQELGEGAWIPAPLEMDLIFKTPIENRWKEAIASQGMHSAMFGGVRAKA